MQQTPPTGTTVTWSIFPNDGSVTLNPIGNSVEVDFTNATLNAPYTLTATITGPCYLGIGTRQFSIPAQAWSGGITGFYGWSNPVYNDNLVEGDNYLYTATAQYFEIWNSAINEQLPPNSNWYWQHVGGDVASYRIGPNAIGFDLFWMGSVDSYYNYIYTDNCGTYSIPFHFMTVYGYPPGYRMEQPKESYQLKLSPNPATNFVMVSVTEIENNKKPNTKAFDYNTQKIIRVYDKLGNLIIQRNELIPKSGLRLNISMLKPSDLYNVIIEDRNGIRLSGKFIKQ